MRIHPQAKIVEQARLDLNDRLSDWHKLHGHDLTTGEMTAVITSILGDELLAVSKWMIRGERHPEDPGKPGGLE